MDSYDIVRDVIPAYYQWRHITNFRTVDTGGPAPMDVGALWRKGGRGKMGPHRKDGEGKGKLMKGKGRGKWSPFGMKGRGSDQQSPFDPLKGKGKSGSGKSAPPQ